MSDFPFTWLVAIFMAGAFVEAALSNIVGRPASPWTLFLDLAVIAGLFWWGAR